jgi:hypothetical protein
MKTNGCFSGKYEEMTKMVNIIENVRKMNKKAKMDLESRKSTRSGFFL